AVELLAEQFSDRAHREAEEMAIGLPREHADGLEPEFLERQIGELGGLPRAVEYDPLDAGAGQMAQRLAEGLARAAVDVDRVGHVLVGQPALLRDALGSEEVPEALPRRRLLRELDDLDGSLAGQALEQQVGQTERDAQTLGERSLAQGAAL